MAIDSTLFAADIPAGTYAVGDMIPLVCIDGPANVRSGRGSAKLKTIMSAQFAAQVPYFRIHVKNSDWIDEVVSFTGPTDTITSNTLLDDESGTSQNGHDCDLTPNSGWQVYAECVIGGTSTTPNSVFCLIDIDYPQVGSVTDPRKAVGLPTSITYDLPTVTSQAYGALVGSTWNIASVDYFKAGYKYVLDALEFSGDNNGIIVSGFVAFSNAAGMGGLTRIIPVLSVVQGIRYPIRYSSILVKGPMDIKVKTFEATPAAHAIKMAHDYVKQRA